MKICTKCGEQKSLEEFASWRKGDSSHKRTKCKQCEKLSNDLLKESKKLAGNPSPPPIGTPCPICKQSSTILCFDHDHKTKKHRGWLCLQCNRAVGQLGDNIEGLENAIRYLKECEFK